MMRSKHYVEKEDDPMEKNAYKAPEVKIVKFDTDIKTIADSTVHEEGEGEI